MYGSPSKSTCPWDVLISLRIQILDVWYQFCVSIKLDKFCLALTLSMSAVLWKFPMFPLTSSPGWPRCCGTGYERSRELIRQGYAAAQAIGQELAIYQVSDAAFGFAVAFNEDGKAGFRLSVGVSRGNGSGAHQQSHNGSGHQIRHGAGKHGTETQFCELVTFIRSQRADAADLNTNRTQVGEAAQGEGGNGE